MKHCYDHASPEQILAVAKALFQARQIVGDITPLANNVVKTPGRDRYIKLEQALRFESCRLEDDFADTCRREFGTPVCEVPLFGCHNNLLRAEHWLYYQRAGGLV